ncbi:NLI interacting factor-like phosphatase-domain-containing protein [Cokeromyces recurvatus]|uniref:NLI interacting factor-like phosphatase-domain-containing protein n=1 Tax=Cokeromyces recurvatus TaxID=90255 RepID=UPI00221EA360|nr:NLI interacting factor-like phosphatase-domain-containing protein [Cokeromyces recurvatus]KAI7906966.1 NLI interacting factor-like phosphatase-domain-containing protein [Cokeromyces recurvatus]
MRKTSITSSPNTINTTTSATNRSKRIMFQQLYELFTFLFKYVQSILYNKQQQTPANNSNSTKSSTHNSIALQYYKGKTLVLDLDETLVHSVRLGTTETKVNPSIKKTIEVTNDRQSILYEVYKRPHVDFFLSTISKWYKVVIFTASMSEYADPVIDWLDQDHSYISQRYFRQSCILKDGNFLKDISIAESDLSKVCLIDNSPAAFALYQENAIPLPTWISNPKDDCLLDLLPLLDALRFTADVRSILSLRDSNQI